MSSQSVMVAPQEQSLPYEAADVAQGLGIQLASFLFPLLVALDGFLDKRRVRTFLGSIQSILTFRDRIHGLLLTELGAALLSPGKVGGGNQTPGIPDPFAQVVLSPSAMRSCGRGRRACWREW